MRRIYQRVITLSGRSMIRKGGRILLHSRGQKKNFEDSLNSLEGLIFWAERRKIEDEFFDVE